MEVPRYGIHDGIKYNKKRYLVRWCIICGNPFHPTGRRDQVCSEECAKIRRDTKYNPELNYKYNRDNNVKWNPINNPKRDATEEERRNRINQWKVWYANLTPEQRQRYNHKKKKGATKKEDTYDDIQAEMRALGLR